MNLVFCADRRMLAGLHVAVQTILFELGPELSAISIWVFSSDLDESDAALLRKTLDETNRKYDLSLVQVDAARFESFPDLQASHATYFRLVVPEILDVDRFLYIDADTLCRTDLLPLFNTDLQGHPIGLIPEAPIDQSADPDVAELLGERAHGHYFNAGVALVDASLWRIERLTEKCFDFIQKHQPRYHDQSALNFVLHGKICCLEDRYNCRTNAREHWPALISPDSVRGRLLHFVDFPKPWSPFGRIVHPLGRLWWQALARTAWVKSAAGVEGSSLNTVMGNRAKYKQSLKDSFLFWLLSRGLVSSVKGMTVE